VKLPITNRYLAFKALNHQVYSIHNKTYGYASSTDEACELPEEYSYVLSRLSAEYILFEDIHQATKSKVDAKELAEILQDLGKSGFISSFDKHTRPISSINIFLSTYCNLNCVYCYGGEGREDGLSGGSYGFKKENMSLEMGKKAVDYLLKTASIRSDHSAGGINFFGGEPLLNLETLKGIVEYAEDQSVKFGVPAPAFSITTNGLLLNEEFIALCKEYDIGVQVSFDGTPEVQNEMRPKNSKQPSYPDVEKALALLKENKLPVRIRATVTKMNLSLMNSINHLESIGVNRVHYAVASGDDLETFAVDDEGIDTLIESFEQVADYTIDRIKEGKSFVHCNNLLSMISQVHNSNEKKFACGAGIGLVSLSPDGQFHVCHRFAGMDEFSIGNIDEGIDYRKRLKLVELMHISSHQECLDCWAKNICGGECPYSNFESNQHMNIPNQQMCKLHQAIVKIAIYMASEIRQFDEETYFNIVENHR